MQTDFRLLRQNVSALDHILFASCEGTASFAFQFGRGTATAREIHTVKRRARALIISYKDVIVLYYRARRPDRYVFRRYRYFSENYSFSPNRCLRDIDRHRSREYWFLLRYIVAIICNFRRVWRNFCSNFRNDVIVRCLKNLSYRSSSFC